jgi:hypothetical protein
VFAEVLSGAKRLRLSLHTAGLRAHESQEGLLVIRTHRCELHPDSLSTFRPPHDSVRTYSGQLGRSTKDHVKLGADGEHFPRTEAEPPAAHVFSIQDVESPPLRQGDRQRCDDPRSTLPFLYCRHSFCTSSLRVTSTGHGIIHPTFRIRAATVCRLLGFAHPRGSTFLHLVCGER